MTTWLHRTVDDRGRLLSEEAAIPWIERRLVLDIHARYYHDIGVEAHPPALDQLDGPHVLRTPHCRQGERRLGLTGDVREWVHDTKGRTWEEFRSEALRRLNAVVWPTRRHLGCFHRRGKARFDLAFSLVAEMASLAPDGTAGVHVLTRRPQLPESLTWWWADHGWEVSATKAPRILVATHSRRVVGAVRTDGTLAGPKGPVDVAQAWRLGTSLATLARRAVEQHGEGWSAGPGRSAGADGLGAPPAAPSAPSAPTSSTHL
ncbi:hypothetical protein AB0912_31360 [Streptomyces sp. NPDC007084]|uniref:hypothetical protein n=1 Tax=Streptomyces sp. NPDC007084 TaxID=3154313 RepID=UPI0034545798